MMKRSLAGKISYIGVLGLALSALLTVANGCDSPSAANPATSIPAATSTLTDTWTGYVSEAPRLLGLRDELQITSNGTPMTITLISFEQTELTKLGSSKTRKFKTVFLIRNLGDKEILFSPGAVFSAANDGGFRLSRGGRVSLLMATDVSIAGGTEREIALEWTTKAFNTISGETSDQTIYVTVNAPLTENLEVSLSKDAGIFQILFSEMP